MLTSEWQPFSVLKDEYTFVELDDMWQRNEVECKFEQLFSDAGIKCGTRHYYCVPYAVSMKREEDGQLGK